MISERTVGKYMRENGIKAQYIEHRTKTTRDCDYSTTLADLLEKEIFNQMNQMQHGVLISHIWTQEKVLSI